MAPFARPAPTAAAAERKAAAAAAAAGAAAAEGEEGEQTPRTRVPGSSGASPAAIEAAVSPDEQQRVASACLPAEQQAAGQPRQQSDAQQQLGRQAAAGGPAPGESPPHCQAMRSISWEGSMLHGGAAAAETAT